VVVDSDLQVRLEVIPELYAKAQEEFDVVFVAREDRPESLLYRTAQKAFYRVFRYLVADSGEAARL
jgi:polyisoprenyl-phosphate glycosyltransferase